MWYDPDPYGDAEGLIDELLNKCPECGYRMNIMSESYDVRGSTCYAYWHECPNCGYCVTE